MNVTMLAAVKKEIENFKEFYDGREKYEAKSLYRDRQGFYFKYD